MSVIGALRQYKSERGLALNVPLDEAVVHGDVSGFERAIQRVMHVDRLRTTTETAELEEVVTGVDLDYSLVGPAFGGTVNEIDAAIEAGEFTIADDELVVADERLTSEMFAVERERRYEGAGDLLDAGDAAVVVR